MAPSVPSLNLVYLTGTPCHCSVSSIQVRSFQSFLALKSATTDRAKVRYGTRPDSSGFGNEHLAFSEYQWKLD